MRKVDVLIVGAGPVLVLGGVLGVDFVVVGGFVVDACIGVLLNEIALLARPQQLVGIGVII